MFSSIFDKGIELSFVNVAIVFIASLLCGIAVALVHLFTHKERKNNSMAYTLLILPVIVSFIIILLNGSIAIAFSLAGLFSLIRFRSEAAEVKDITYVLVTAGIGLACGLGYISLSVILTVFMVVLFLVLHFISFAKPKGALRTLKIVIPQDMQYDEVFDGVLKKYCNSYELTRVKTCDYGSLFEITYYIDLKDVKLLKEFIDELRILNSNLDISVNLKYTIN